MFLLFEDSMGAIVRRRRNGRVGYWTEGNFFSKSQTFPFLLKPCVAEGVLEGMSGTSATADASGLRETDREALTFSGMGGAVFAGLPPFEAVHFDEAEVSGSDRHDEVHAFEGSRFPR